MRWLILSLFVIGFALPSILLGYAPLYPKHDTTGKVDEEFRNIEASLQDQQFTIYTSTPVLSTVKDGAIFIVYGGSSTIWSALMWRRGNEIYKVNGSCITVVR